MKLTPLDTSRYEAWMRESIRGYAESNVESGRWDASGAMEKSERSYAELLPDGLATPNHFIFELYVGDSYVGYLWVFVDPSAAVPSAFIYDIEIVVEQRAKGLGKQAMQALEPWCVERSLRRIALNVFAFNKPAIELYNGLGYQTTNFSMQKDL